VKYPVRLHDPGFGVLEAGVIHWGLSVHDLVEGFVVVVEVPDLQPALLLRDEVG